LGVTPVERTPPLVSFAVVSGALQERGGRARGASGFALVPAGAVANSPLRVPPAAVTVRGVL
jgi:hypothetical protein